ncbi:AAA-like domain-containing protein, partial [Marinitoga sp. 1155]|uniref:AAA-like domain-containing protein n=1 Tax=Marinitoga sp. 1155 TaxID=1428448 RepID=UPI000640FC46
MRIFCTSGPVDKKTCYYIERPDIMEEALEHIENWRYFNIISPEESGKTTFLKTLIENLRNKYLTIYISLNGYGKIGYDEFKKKFINDFRKSLKEMGADELKIKNLKRINNIILEIAEKENKEIILMVDDFEKLKTLEVLNEFLHTIRAMFHMKKEYKLRSVIFSGAKYIPIMPDDKGSPYNIAEHMEIPYFTKEQVYDLLSQHETETGQIFDEKVKELIWHNAAGQPGLTNGLAYDLVMKKAKGEKIITEKHFEKTLYDYMYVYIDKNIANIINKAKNEKDLIMKILFEPNNVEFNIYDENIKFLYLNGLIDNCNGKCCVRVPLYYKALYARFKPKVNIDNS